MFKIKRWIPAITTMTIIFLFSGTRSIDLPYYGIWDFFIKKGGHFIGYAILSVTCWYGLNFYPKKIRLAWLLAIIYAASDEFHQSFVPGRHPSLVDTFIFDGAGATFGLSLMTVILKALNKSGDKNKQSNREE